MKKKEKGLKVKGRSSKKYNGNKESQELMLKANQCYFERDNEESLKKAKEAIVADPDNPAPFQLMRKFFILSSL